MTGMIASPIFCVRSRACLTPSMARPYDHYVRRYLSSFVLLTLLFGAGCAREKEAVPNVRLGMTPRDVRDRFHPGGEGSWHTALGTGDDTTLEWRARDAAAPVAHAQFEFHLGMLVAIRAQLNESVSGEHVTTTPKSVTVKKAVPEGGASVIVLARDCPTHKDEADSLASKAHGSRRILRE